MRRSAPLRRLAALALLTVTALATLTARASAAPRRNLNGGYFWTPGVPVYAEPPDGWACQIARRCVSSLDYAESGARAMYRSVGPRDGHREPISDVVCVRGEFVLIDTAIIGRGWAAGYVRTDTPGEPERGYLRAPDCVEWQWS